MTTTLRIALESALESLPVMTHDNGYPVQAMPKADLLSLLALYPPTVPDVSAQVVREHEPAPMGCACGAPMGDSIDYRWHLVNQTIAALKAALA